jgi:H+-transporting ATPase
MFTVRTTPNKSKAEPASSKSANAKPPDIASASVPDTLVALHVNPDTGLTRAEVDVRRKEHGYNEVAEKRGHPVLKFLRKFWGISAWMLELIMVLSAVLGKYSDLVVVGALLVINAVLSFMQERRAAGVVEALRRRLQVNARVRRESSWQVIPARELVPGDIVRVRPGDIIPADVKLLTGALTVDQSALTGESKDADKAPREVLSSGSVVRRGEGNGVVMLTGAKTYFGRTTELVQEARPKLHIEAVVAKVVRWLFVIVGALLCVVIVLSLIRNAPLLEMVSLMLVLLMSAVPVALPVMFTVSMAVGSKELAKLGVLVTRLSAAEDAATMDVLCVDKTGTITMNHLAVTGVIPLEHATEADVLFAGALASQEANQDPIDLAFLAAAKERHVFDNVPKVAPVSFAPFDAKNRRTEAVVEQNGQRLRVMKGAVRTVAEACGLQPPAIEALGARVNESAAKGYRTLAVARGPETGAPALVGLVTLYDPPRPDAKELIATLHDLGVPVKMLTGDALPVAREIARGVGLPNIRRVADLKAAGAQAGNEAVDLLAGADGFAEVYPEDKYIVVQHLQAAGHVTGMTGDGVNDAPALRQAEVGIAVSTATDVAKGAASVVLTEPGLTNIVALVEQGRTIYQRILTWIINKISRTILKAAFVAIAFVVTGKFVVSAFAMLLLVFMTDFAKIALATDNVRPSKKPETWNIGGFIIVSVVLGVAMVAEALLFLWIGWSLFGLATNNNALYTFSFLMLLYLAVFSVVSARERRWFWSTMPSKTLMASLIADALAGTVLTRVGLPGLMPLPWSQTLVIFAYAMVSCLIVNDAVKVLMIKWRVPNAVATKPVDVTSQIAKRAYELYEQRGRQDGRAVQDWEKAEREIRKLEAKAKSKPEAKPEAKSEAKAEPKPDAKAEAKPDVKAEPKPEAKAEPKPEAKAEPKPEVKAEPKPEPKAKIPPDLTPQIVKRVHKLYEELGREDVRAVQGWEKTEREIRKDEPKAESKPEVKAETKPENKVEAKPETKVEPKPEAKVDLKPETKAEPKPQVKTESKSKAKEESKPEAKTDPKTQSKPEPEPKAETEAKPTVEPKPEAKEVQPETKTEPPSDVSPQIVKRVHELYEELGREEVQAVEDWEKAERENRKDEAKAETKPEAKAEPKAEAKAEPEPHK